MELPELHPYRLGVTLLVRHQLFLEFGLLLLQPLQSLEELPLFLSGEHDGIAFRRSPEQALIPNLQGNLGQSGHGSSDSHFGYSAFVEVSAAVRRLQVSDQLP